MKILYILVCFLGLTGTIARAATLAWEFPNFSDRLEMRISNSSPQLVHSLVRIPISTASSVAPGFPGTLAIAIVAGHPLTLLPSQVNGADGNDAGREFVFPIDVPARATLAVHIYYSQTLHAEIPWQRQTFASHSFGYNHATAALESQRIGYRTYGGFFLDVQARAKNHSGLMNELVGFLSASASAPSPAGQDVLHIGNTLGLGGLFLRTAERTYQPPLNTPDYAHKTPSRDVPVYRVLATGPVEAIVEASMNHWAIGNDIVSITETYSIAAGDEAVRCHFKIVPIAISGEYKVGAGIRTLPTLHQDDGPGRLSLSGEQDKATGPLGLALYFDSTTASAAGLLAMPDGDNEIVLFHNRLTKTHVVEGTFWVAAAWSGSGIPDPLRHLRLLGAETESPLVIRMFAHSVTPAPQRLEGEAY